MENLILVNNYNKDDSCVKDFLMETFTSYDDMEDIFDEDSEINLKDYEIKYITLDQHGNSTFNYLNDAKNLDKWDAGIFFYVLIKKELNETIKNKIDENFKYFIADINKWNESEHDDEYIWECASAMINEELSNI